MMSVPRARLSLQALRTWMSFNDAVSHGVKVQPVELKGNGLIAEESWSGSEQLPLLVIPHGLVLNQEAVDEYAKEDSNFSALLNACGRKSPRHDILLFLLVHVVVSSQPKGHVALSNPWTEYVKLLDDHVPLPTMWAESERELLQGTSLEAALDAKMLALTREFDELRERSSDLDWWRSAFWDSNLIHLKDWYLVDSWFRSRALELPRSGLSLVPCLDIVNHHRDANSYYDETIQGEVLLLRRPGAILGPGDEVTINYGSEKPDAEMLFTYGFLDPSSPGGGLRLRMSPLPDDPLGKAKVHILGGNTSIELKSSGDKIYWHCPFAYLACLNEEDGLEFKLLQASDGSQELRVFWQEEDVTDNAECFEGLITSHELCDIYRLRVSMIVSQSLEAQLERLTSSPFEEIISPSASYARELKRIEKGIIRKALSSLQDQVSSPLKTGCWMLDAGSPFRASRPLLCLLSLATLVCDNSPDSERLIAKLIDTIGMQQSQLLTCDTVAAYLESTVRLEEHPDADSRAAESNEFS